MLPIATYPDAELPLLVAAATTSKAGSSPDLGVYPVAWRMNAFRALSITYPTLVSLLGEDTFHVLIAMYVKQYPAAQSDWGTWGRSLPAWLAQQAELDAYPYLPDVAKLDWLCHTTERAQDGQLDMASLMSLGVQPLNQVFLSLAAGVQVMSSVYPIVQIWMGHHGPEHERADWMDQAHQALGLETTQYVLVHRQPWRAMPCVITRANYAFLSAVRSGLTLERAVDLAIPFGFDFVPWLNEAVQGGLVLEISD